MIVVHTEQELGIWTGGENNRFLQTFINSSAYPQVHGCSVGMVIVPPETEGGLHSHREAQEIWYIISGKGRMQIGDEWSDIAPGDVIYGPEHVPHQIVNNQREGDLKALLVLCPGGDEQSIIEALAADRGVIYQADRD